MQGNETLTCGAYRYTLAAIGVGGDTYYTISASDGGGTCSSLEQFTESQSLAEAYLALLARNAVDPCQIRDVWEDLIA